MAFPSTRLPFHLLLLPLCFAAYALSVHFGRASVADALLAAVLTGGIMLLIFGLLRLIFRKPLSAALLTTTAATLYLYWDYPYLRIKSLGGDSRWASLPVLLVVCMLLLMAAGVFFIKTTNAFREKMNRFLNALFGVLLLYNSGVYIHKRMSASQILAGEATVAKGKASAPVFILLLDELWSLENLRKQGFQTAGIDTFLQEKGFYLAGNSRSNYPMTHFSMASAFNENYLRYEPGQTIYFRDYNAAQVVIRNSIWVESFRKSGYQLRNRSVFSIADTPPFGDAAALQGGWSALFSGTLGGKVLWPVFQKKFFPQRLANNWFSGLQRHEDLLTAIGQDAHMQQPVLCYAHFFLPHTPFCFDEKGKRLSFDSSVVWSVENNPRGYAGNVLQALEYLKKSIALIRKNCPQALVLVISDHGYRNSAFPGNDTTQFQNFCAVYYPDQNYAGWYSDITLVNAFRLLHNKALETKLPLLPDKTVLLKDAAGLEW